MNNYSSNNRDSFQLLSLTLLPPYRKFDLEISSNSFWLNKLFINYSFTMGQ